MSSSSSSTMGQNGGGGKKMNSGGSSGQNTPAPTVANGQAQGTPPPPNNNAPKYGTLVPNRIFVGGISANTTESELLQLFSNYGTVKAAKIIQDRAGVSKGYGFVTFESEDDARRLQRDSDNIVLRERKLNIAPAIKKQPFGRAFDASSPPNAAVAGVGATPYYFQAAAAAAAAAGTMPFFQGGVAYYPQAAPPPPQGDATAGQTAAGAAVYQPAPPVYPAQSAPPQTAAYPSVMFPQPIYVPQQYPMHMPYDYYNYPPPPPPNGAAPQYLPQHQQQQQQPPGSPPRQQQQHGYGQQQQPYNTAEAVYFNYSMYAPVDGPAIYTDANGVELANGSSYVEDSQFILFDIGQDAVENTSNTAIIASSQSPFNTTTEPQNHNQQQPRPPSHQQQRDTPTPSAVDTSRQSSTPVVSLLSIDQRHEKDPTAMQGGRRKRPVVPPSPVGYHSAANGYVVDTYNGYYSNPFDIYQQQHNNHRHPSYNGNQNNNSNGRRFTNGWSNSNSRRNGRETALSTRSDSNSSASAVDENRNEEKCSPPPTTPHQGGKWGGRGAGRGGMTMATTTFRQRRFFPSRADSIDGMVTSQQHFAPPSRNVRGGGGSGRRPLRRNASAPLGEIGGAGDAPLPGGGATAGVTDVSDACKKLDSLKL